jgi:hypothetical protein
MAPRTVGRMPPQLQFGLALFLARRSAHLPLVARRPASSSRAKSKLRSAPPAHRSGALGTHNRWRHPESGPAIEFPAEISFAALSAGLCGSRPLAAADSPLVGQRSSISKCFALFMSRAAGALGRKPRRSGGRRPRRRAFHETGRCRKRIHETERRENLSEPRATNVHCLITDGASPDRNPLLRPAGDLPRERRKD